MKEQLEQIKQQAIAEIHGSQSSLEEIRIKYLGKKGQLTAILRGMGSLSAEERPVIGAIANTVREKIEQALADRMAELKKLNLEKSLREDKLDVTSHQAFVHQVLKSLRLNHRLALIVVCTAGIKTAVTDRRLPRIRFPEVERLYRHYVVMGVDQHSWYW